MSEKSCATCLYNSGMGDCLAEQCLGDMDGWRPKDNPQVSITSNRVGGTSDKPIYSVSFVDKIEKALPKEDKFSLDKLIDDHWKYVESTLRAHDCHAVEIEIARHHYRTAAYHFWKHCTEHYRIEEKNDEQTLLRYP